MRAEPTTVTASGVRFERERVLIELSDGPEVSLGLRPTPWLAWLYRASPQQRTSWSIEPSGFAVYWNALDDGIEVAHLLSGGPIA